MKSEVEIRDILVEVGNYSPEDADDIIDSVQSGNHEEMRTHILSQTGIDIDKY
jgi:hypothetical protein